MARRIKKNGGFTLLELLITMGILIAIGGAIFTFGRDLFSVNNFLEETFREQLEADGVIQDIVAELRSASASSIGGYPIEQATPNAIAFYANIDKDSLKERVQYFLSDSRLMKSVVKPAGSVLTYATTTATENLRPVLRGIVASSTAPIFAYYDKNYAGTEAPLAFPVNVLDIRMVKINFIVDTTPDFGAPAITVSSKVSIRNLKDNL